MPITTATKRKIVILHADYLVVQTENMFPNESCRRTVVHCRCC